MSFFVLLRRRSLKRVIAEKSTRITLKWFESINLLATRGTNITFRIGHEQLVRIY